MANLIANCSHCGKDQAYLIDPFNGDMRCRVCNEIIGRDPIEGPEIKFARNCMEEQFFKVSSDSLAVAKPKEKPKEKVKKPKPVAHKPEKSPEKLVKKSPKVEVEIEEKWGFDDDIEEKTSYWQSIKTIPLQRVFFVLSLMLLTFAVIKYTPVVFYAMFSTTDQDLETVVQNLEKEPLQKNVSEPKEKTPTSQNHSPRTQEITPEMIVDAMQKLRTKAIQKIFPSVVTVVKQIYSDKNTPVKVGTGVIIDDRGYVITNYHVISGEYTRIHGNLPNGQTLEYETLATDPISDLALLKILNFSRYKGLYSVCKWGKDSDVEVGETVFALGHPGGDLPYSLAQGMISNTKRYLDVLPVDNHEFCIGYFNNWLQLDIALNQGYSGGPLFNFQGEVIGINTRKKQVMSGIGFAIPCDHAQKIVDDLIRYGEVIRSSMGILWEPSWQTSGAKVMAVIPNSPAEKSGILDNDIVTSVDGKFLFTRDMRDMPMIRNMESSLVIDKSIAIEVKRGNTQMKLSIVPERREDFYNSLSYFHKLGFWGIPMNNSVKRYIRSSASNGVWICKLKSGSFLEQAGVFKGDILIGIDNQYFRNTTDFLQAYNDLPEGKSVTFILQTEHQIRKINILLPN